MKSVWIWSYSTLFTRFLADCFYLKQSAVLPFIEKVFTFNKNYVLFFQKMLTFYFYVICNSDIHMREWCCSFPLRLFHSCKSCKTKTRCVVDVTKHKQSGLEDKAWKVALFSDDLQTQSRQPFSFLLVPYLLGFYLTFSFFWPVFTSYLSTCLLYFYVVNVLISLKLLLFNCFYDKKYLSQQSFGF